MEGWQTHGPHHEATPHEQHPPHDTDCYTIHNLKWYKLINTQINKILFDKCTPRNEQGYANQSLHRGPPKFLDPLGGPTLGGSKTFVKTKLMYFFPTSKQGFVVNRWAFFPWPTLERMAMVNRWPFCFLLFLLLLCLTRAKTTFMSFFQFQQFHPKSQNPHIPKSPNSQISKYTKYTNIQIYKYTNIQIYKYTKIQISKYTNIHIPKITQAVGFTSVWTFLLFLLLGPDLM